MMLAAQIVAIALTAPLLQGAMKRLRARLQGRPGPSVLQPYRDLAKLMGKQVLLPEDASFVAVIAPGVAYGVALTFAAVLPLGARLLTFFDVIALIFLLALGRFGIALAALDVRSAFTAMAASRDMTFAALAEPALLLALFGGILAGHGPELRGLAGMPFGMPGLLAIAAFFVIVLAETARIPFDNQETHYELTMIHEGLGLEFSGWQLALVQHAAFIRQLCFLVLASLLLPGSGLLAHAAWVAVLACTIVVVETLLAKVRLYEVSQLFATALLLAVASIALRIGRWG
jgi:formate hydrogenlyase subunit 4